MIINEINSSISANEIAEIRKQMLNFAKLQLQDSNVAEDMVQESLLSAVKNITNFKRQAALKTWVFAILKNKIVDHLRQKDRLVLESDLLSDDENGNSFFDQNGHWKEDCQPKGWQENAVYSDEFWLIFETCLTYLPAKQAKVFMMREYLELPADEICGSEEITSSNLHVLLYRARLQLQHCLSTKLA